jgi:LCP family protein required for cell wall assembly
MSKEASKKWSTRKKLVVSLICAAVAIVAIAATAMALYFSNLDNTIRISEPERLKALEAALTVPETGDDPYYTLLLGSDSRDVDDASAGLSDTIMLVRVDPQTPQASVLSIPRDTEIVFGDYGNIKINAVYTYEHEVGAVKAVEQLCGVQIAHFVEIDFTGVQTLVDRIGGVDVVVPVSFELDGIVIEEGLQHLDGYQALLFSRARAFPLGDFQRVVDQRILLQAVVKKVLTASKDQLPALVQSLADCVRTDVTVGEAAGLLSKLTGMADESLYMGTIPTTTNGHDGISFVAVVEPEFSQVMERFRSGLPPIDPDAPPDVSSQTGVVMP